MMKSDFPTNDTIREYLLGRLDGRADLEAQLSEQMLFNDELSEIVDSVEDEIIEDYLDGTVSSSDRRAIEEYFLRPAERREKLQFACLLRRQFQSGREAPEKKKLDVPRDSEQPFRWVFQFRTWCEVAAVVLVIGLGLIYMHEARRRLRSQLEAAYQSQIQIQDELAQERHRSANLTKQLEEVRPPVALLTFLGPVFRADGGAPVLDISPWTQRIRVEIGLRSASSGAYDVRLETRAGKTIWFQSKVPASSGGLRFDVPTEGISAGNYCLTVSSQLAPYCFDVRIIK